MPGSVTSFMSASQTHSSKAQAAIRRKLMAAARAAKGAKARNGEALPRAFFVTDPARTPDPLAIVGRLPRGMCVIWRHYGQARRLATGLALAQLCRRRGLILLVSADPALAVRIGASGVHWPERLLRGVRPRARGMVETAAAHSRAAIASAMRLGIDAVIVSTVFPSRSPTAGPAMGPLRFRQLAGWAPLPVYALGGVDAINAASAMRHAAGWAAIDSVITGWGKR
jgi:thiamine-phosphate pyrophosphorylase